jgi:general secretion pathway protein J
VTDRGERGFTLVELLVSLLIFGMLSAAGVALLSVSVRAQAMAGERLEGLADVRRAGALLTADLAQAARRPYRDSAGEVRPAFTGEPSGEGVASLVFVRRGWDNADGRPRPSLQKVAYRLAGGRLERIAYPLVDGAEPMAAAVLIENVRGVSFRYRDEDGGWRDRWDPTDPAALPVAVEMVATTERGGALRQLFLTGAEQ